MYATYSSIHILFNQLDWPLLEGTEEKKTLLYPRDPCALGFSLWAKSYIKYQSPRQKKNTQINKNNLSEQKCVVQTPPPHPLDSSVEGKWRRKTTPRDTNIHPNELLFFFFQKPNSSSSQSHDLRRADHRKTNEKVVVSLPESVVNLVCKCVCECVCECMYVCIFG